MEIFCPKNFYRTVRRVNSSQVGPHALTTTVSTENSQNNPIIRKENTSSATILHSVLCKSEQGTATNQQVKNKKDIG